MRILLVDDNFDLRITMSALLQSAGFDVREAADGASAISVLLESGPFDALITDVVMPGMSGIDLAHEARRHYPGLAVVLLSGYVPPTQDLPKNWQFVQKPCNLTDLLVALRKVDHEAGSSSPASSLVEAPHPDNFQVLLVEDSQHDAYVAMRTMEKCGIPADRIVVAEDGEEAWHYLCRKGNYANRIPENPRLIILDLKLPKVDGIELLKKLRAEPALSGIRVVIFTASAMETDVRRTQELGVSAYVVKPPGLQATLAALKPALERALQ